MPDDSDETIEKVRKSVEATIMAPILAQIQASSKGSEPFLAKKTK